MSDKLIIDELKKSKNMPMRKYSIMSAYLISERLSPYISALYIKLKITPNQITIQMIISGIIGSVFFAIPNIYVKILGAIFIHLWYILDFSDGEVARYTKTFSKYGKELDYMAHLINHPLMGISIFFAIAQLKRTDIYVIALIIFTSNLLDYLYRNFVMLDVISKNSNNGEGMSNIDLSKASFIKKSVLIIVNLFTVYPNIVLFGVIFYFVDYFAGSNILLIFILASIAVSIIFAIRRLIQLTIYFYKG